ncbi:hypothetical protein ACJRPK_01585 [Aquimarina sp. 2-A2]|uniref:hypothetical protein n=1 Tax=Aquimarina sp. 2-A2 TaxID=3382644 RepID=UPI00387F0013
MEVIISKTFASDFRMITDISFKEKIKSIVASLENSKDTSALIPIQAFNASDRYFKMGVGFYYLIIKNVSKKSLALVRVVHRDQLRQSLHKSI